MAIKAKTNEKSNDPERDIKEIKAQEEALKIRTADGYPVEVAYLDNLGEFYKAQDRYDEAEPLFMRALEIRENSLGPDHPNTDIVRNNLKTLLENSKKAKSDTSIDRAFIQQVKTTYGKGHETEFENVKQVEFILIKGTYTLISAGKNPKRDEDANKPPEYFSEQHELLKKELIRRGVLFTQVVGKHRGLEDLHLVMAHNLYKNEAIEIGSAFKQDSVRYVTEEKNQLIYTTDSRMEDGTPIPKGSYYEGEGWENVGADATDNYTELDVGGSQRARFRLNFDFDNLKHSVSGASAVHERWDKTANSADQTGITLKMGMVHWLRIFDLDDAFDDLILNFAKILVLRNANREKFVHSKLDELDEYIGTHKKNGTSDEIKTLIVDWITDQERAIPVLEKQLNDEWIAEIEKEDDLDSK